MFDKYFRAYEDDEDPKTRREKLFRKSGTIRTGIEDMIFRTKEEQDPDYYTYLLSLIHI